MQEAHPHRLKTRRRGTSRDPTDKDFHTYTMVYVPVMYYIILLAAAYVVDSQGSRADRE